MKILLTVIGGIIVVLYTLWKDKREKFTVVDTQGGASEISESTVKQVRIETRKPATV